MKNDWPSGFKRFECLAAEINQLVEDPSVLPEVILSPFAENYLRSVKEDMELSLAFVVQNTQLFEGAALIPRYTVNRAVQYQASAKLGDAGRPSYDFSVGLYLTLDDIFFNCCSSREFLGFDFRCKKISVPRKPCLWLNKCGYYFPATRYFDYTADADFMFLQLLAERGHGAVETYTSVYFEQIPYQDDARCELAAIMSAIAFS